MKPVKFPNRMQVSFSNIELDLIEQYANSRGIKKATAVKELAIRGLELTDTITSKTELYEKILPILQYINQEDKNDITAHVILAIELVNKANYSKALEVLNNLKNLTTKVDVVECIESTYKHINNYTSNNLYNKLYEILDSTESFSAEHYLKIKHYIETNKYLELLEFLSIYDNMSNQFVEFEQAIDLAIEEVKKYESSYNINNYLKNR